MKTLTVKLKQHTPLIHFQHDQYGATLRASEVKPKLDKFLIERLGTLEELGDANYDIIPDEELQKVADSFNDKHPEKDFNDLGFRDQYIEIGRYIAAEKGWFHNDKVSDRYKIGKYIAAQKGWLVGKGEHSSLDYKMSIRSKGSKNVSMNVTPKNGGYETDDYPDRENSLFMGNMGGRPKDEVLNFIMNDTIDITLCFKSDEIYNGLNVIIKQSICSFFIRTGFGNRSSKGFGSFTVREIDGKQQQLPRLEKEWKLLPFKLVSDNFDIRIRQDDLRRDDNDADLKNALHDVFVIISKVWKFLKKDSNGNGLNGRDLRRVMLGMDAGLTGNEARIPSCLSFRPVLSKDAVGYRVNLYIVLNLDVMACTQNNPEDFYVFMDKKYDWYKKNVTDGQVAAFKRKWNLNYDVEL